MRAETTAVATVVAWLNTRPGSITEFDSDDFLLMSFSGQYDGGWEAVITTHLMPLTYFEASYDPESKETIVDEYKRVDSVSIQDDEIEIVALEDDDTQEFPAVKDEDEPISLAEYKKKHNLP